MARLSLTDGAWELIADVFPEPGATDRPRCDARTMLDGILWLKESRRIFSRYKETAKNFGGMLALAFIRQYLRYELG